jgi:gliding motility-associated-like protein
MNRILPFIVFVFSFLSFGTTKASHMMGADMSYTCLGNGKYKIVAKVYRDCRGISFDNPSYGAYAGTNGGNGCGSVSLSGMTRTGIRDVTTRCSTASSPCNPKNTWNTGKGVEEHTYEMTVDFTKSPLSNFVNKSTCCEVTFTIGQCCRNGAITTGAAGADFWASCMINICNIKKTTNKCNSSPSLTNEPVGFLCCNTPWYYNNGALDSVDFDSISYRLVRGLSSLPNGSVTYSSPFTQNYPMTPFCVPPTTIKCDPKPNLNPPRGFFFDTTNGDIIVTPTKCDEVPILVIEQTEWRKDSATGAWIVVGRTRRDMQMWVLDECGYNKPPVINGPFSWTICEGDKITKKVKITDETFTPNQTIPDTVLATWNGGIPGATFTVVDPTKREKEYEFAWQTKRGDASDVSYSFTVRATDQHCTPPMISIRSFKVKVNPRAEATRDYDTLKCGKFAMTSILPANFIGKATYQWSVRDSQGKKELFFSTKKSDTMTFYKGGKYIFVHTVNNTFNCPTIYRDTVMVPDPPTVILATKDTFACYGTSMNLTPLILHGKSPYKYYWTRLQMDTMGGKVVLSNESHISGDTLNQISVPKVLTDSAIRVRVTDGDGCKFYDTAMIYVKPLPKVNLGADKRICTYEKQLFDAENADTVKYLWSTADTTQKIYPNVKGKYWVRVMEKTFKCIQYDTVELFVNDTVTAIAGADQIICNEKSTKITAQHRPVFESATYEWKSLTESKTLGSNYEYTVTPKNSNTPGGSAQTYYYSVYTKVTQKGYTCEDLDTMSIKINTLPIVRWDKKPLPAQCYNYGDIELNSMINVGKMNGVRIWSGALYKKDIYVDSFTATRHLFMTTKLKNEDLQNGKNFQTKVFANYKDTNGCVNVDSTVQRINGNPILQLKNTTYCQDLGEVSMDNNVIRPMTKTGIKFDWKVNQVPAGVNSSTVLYNNNPMGTPDFRLKFGDPTEDFYMGLYKFGLCIEDILTGCRSCDTTQVTIVGEPTVKVISPNPLCVNWDTIDLYKNVTVNGNPGADGDGGKFEIVEVDYDRSHAKVGTKLPLGHLFPPSFGPGTYYIRYSNIGTGCLKQDSFYVYVNDTPDAVLLAPLVLCEGSTPLDLNTRINRGQTKPSSGVATWQGANLTGSSFNPLSTKTAALEGPYNLKLAYTDNNGCADTEIYVLMVRTKPEIKITTVNPYPQCENSPFPVQSVSNFNNKSIQWTITNGSDGKIDQPTSENIVYTHGTQDAVNKKATLKVATIPLANDVCPPAADSILIVIHPYPQLDPLTSANGCVPLATNWTVTETKGIPASQLSYLWVFGNGDSSTFATPSNIMYPKQGKYSVKVTVTNNTPDGGACATTISGTENVEAYPLPVAYFETDPSYSTTVALPKFTMINKTTVESNPFNPTLSYVWDFGTGNANDTAMSSNPRFAYSRDTGLYQISMIASTDKGCKDTFMRKVFIGPDIIVFIPDIFTPNVEGPQTNETFNVVATNFKTFNLTIFNRWGEKLFETNNVNEGWNGKDFKGVDCQQGVYVYHVVITSFEDKEYVYDGTVTLLR